MFRAWFDETEWVELKRSAACVEAGNEAEARRLRLERQKKMLAATSALAVPADEEQAHEELWTSCAEEVKRVCDSFGLALRRVAAAKAVAVVSAVTHDRAVVGRARSSRVQQGKKREERPESEESDSIVGKKAKALLAEEEANDDDDEASVASLSSSSEQQESGMEMAVEDAGDEQEVLQAFQRARADAEETVAFLHEMRGKSVEVGDFVAPDATGASAAEGRKVLRDDALLSTCFCKGDDSNGEDLERLGLLQRWWRLIRRCYAVVAVFDHLAATKRKKAVALFNETIKKTVPKACSYVQATRLERIGRLVLRYPRLVYQTQFTSIRDWCYKLRSTDSLLLDSLENLLSAEDLAFWAMQGNDATCYACGLWKCADCACWFHETCCGYKQGSLCIDLHLIRDNQVIETTVLCGQCLEARADEIDCDFVARDTNEKQIVANFLNAEGCLYRWRKVVGDGTCCFRLLHEIAVQRLGYAGALAAFCKSLAMEALVATQEAVAELGPDAAEGESVTQLKRIAKSRNPVRDLQNGAWHDIEAQQVLLGFVRMFPRACIHRFAVDEDTVAEREVYGEAGDMHAYLLQWNVLPHFDELVVV